MEKHCTDEVYYARYADDFLMLFQYENEAQAVLEALKEILGKFSLEVAENKTRILPNGQIKGTKDHFDYLDSPSITLRQEKSNTGWESKRARRS